MAVPASGWAVGSQSVWVGHTTQPGCALQVLAEHGRKPVAEAGVQTEAVLQVRRGCFGVSWPPGWMGREGEALLGARQRRCEGCLPARQALPAVRLAMLLCCSQQEDLWQPPLPQEPEPMPWPQQAQQAAAPLPQQPQHNWMGAAGAQAPWQQQQQGALPQQRGSLAGKRRRFADGPPLPAQTITTKFAAVEA